MSSNFEILGIYEKLHILSHVDDENFRLICSTDSELRKVCLGKQTVDEIAIEGNRTQYLYETRCRAKFKQEVINLKKHEPNISWKEFYDRISIFNLYKIDNLIINYYMIKGYLLEILFLEFLGLKINYPKYFSLLIWNEHIHILEWIHSQNIVIPKFYISVAAFGNKNKTVEWAKSKGIMPKRIYTMFDIPKHFEVQFYPNVTNEVEEMLNFVPHNNQDDNKLYKFPSLILPLGYTFIRIKNSHDGNNNKLVIIPIEKIK